MSFLKGGLTRCCVMKQLITTMFQLIFHTLASQHHAGLLQLTTVIIKSTAYSNAPSTAPLMYLIVLVSQIKPIENSQIISVFSLQLFLAWIYVLLKKG